MELDLVIILVVQEWSLVFYNVEYKTCKVRNIIIYATFHLYMEYIHMLMLIKSFNMHMRFTNLGVNMWAEEINTTMLMWIPIGSWK
jgi:hypothetical protein